MQGTDHHQDIMAQVQAALAENQPLRLQGGNSKGFYGHLSHNDKILDMGAHQGILRYDAHELVITARAGTKLSDIEATLSEKGQMLGFEPPILPNATLGGNFACGFAGPRRPFAGAMRDSVLGIGMINGHGEALRFGGEVIKNVAGYDISRLQCGALGSMGVMTQISLKTIPKPKASLTLRQSCDMESALLLMRAWQDEKLPTSANLYRDGQCYLRLCGHDKTLEKAMRRLALKTTDDEIWQRIRNQELDFFNQIQDDEIILRVILPYHAPPLTQYPTQMIEWGGQLRWVKTKRVLSQVRAELAPYQAQATLYKYGKKVEEIGPRFPPLAAPLAAIQDRLRQAFDPKQIFNRDIMTR